RLVEKVLVHLLAEELVRQLDRAPRDTLLVVCRCRRHRLSYFFPAASFAASSLAGRMTTSPLGFPGTAPRTATRFWSVSTATTTRFFAVMRAVPMWPGRRLPLMTRDGNADAPIDPGWSLVLVPWLMGPPLKR